MFLQSLFHYLCLSSALFVYGIGLKKMIVTSNKPEHYFLALAKTTVTALVSTFLCYLINRIFLVPFALYDIAPFFAILITMIIAIPLNMLWEKIFKCKVSEFLLTFCAVLLAIIEGVNLGDSIAITLACVFSYYLLIPLIYSIRWRMQYSHSNIVFVTGALLFITIAILLLVLLAFNVSWLNLGVL